MKNIPTSTTGHNISKRYLPLLHRNCPALIAAFVAIGCGDSESDIEIEATATAIQSGNSLPLPGGKNIGAGSLSSSAGTCSGTLLRAPDEVGTTKASWFLTARHCLDSASLSSFRVRYDGNGMARQTVAANARYLHPWNRHPQDADDSHFVDVGLLHLATPVTLDHTDTRVRFFAGSKEDYLTHAGTESVLCVGGGSVANYGMAWGWFEPKSGGVAEQLLVVEPNSAGADRVGGDSGGPCFLDVGASSHPRWELVSVHKGAGSMGAWAWRDWVADTIARGAAFNPAIESGTGTVIDYTKFCGTSSVTLEQWAAPWSLRCGEGQGHCESSEECQAGLTCNPRGALMSGVGRSWAQDEDLALALCEDSSRPLHRDCNMNSDCPREMVCTDAGGYVASPTASGRACEYSSVSNCTQQGQACTEDCPCQPGETGCVTDDECRGNLVCRPGYTLDGVAYPSVCAHPKTQGMHAFWGFDRELFDRSGRNRPLWDSTATTWVDGPRHEAISFNQGGFVRGYDVMNELEPPFSYSAWVRVRSSGTSARIFETDGENTNYYGFWVSLNGADMVWSAHYGDGGGAGPASRRSRYSSVPFPLNEWTHIAVVVPWHGAISLYANGTRVNGSSSGTGGPIKHNSGRVRLGNHDAASPSFPGAIDDVRVFDYDISEELIQALATPTTDISN